MKLQDYLHYYMGATFCTDNSQSEVNPETLRFIYPMIEKGKSVQLLLRRFEDITKEQMKAIWGLIFDRPFNENGRIDWFEKETFSACKRWIMWSGVERVGIELNGKVWADSDLHNYKYNPHVVTHYLLQQHFDLFGLIDAGLAVDVKTTAL